uniref:Transmembrane protein n=1 Tax=Cyclophora tenuis TaxID=216820 RepID=A0A7S1DEV2_CYCTE
MIASAVMVASVAQFYRNQESGIFRRRNLVEDSNSTDANSNNQVIIRVFGSEVLRWKLTGALIVSIVGVVSSSILFAAHFETYVAPQLWRTIFQDGSNMERNILLLNILFWAAAIHICTSSLSVGASQANVYFTTWIAFGSSVLNFDVWRAGANLPTFGDVRFDRDTSHNWVWIIVSLTLSSFSALDMYFQRNDLEFIVDGEVFAVPDSEWIRALSLTFGFLGLSSFVLIGNSFLSSCKIRLCWGLSVEWRHFELLTILGLLGTWGWVIFIYTGVDDSINQPGNAYFGIWSTFFNAIFVLGTWMRENRTLVAAFYADFEDEDNSDPLEKSESEKVKDGANHPQEESKQEEA